MKTAAVIALLRLTLALGEANQGTAVSKPPQDSLGKQLLDAVSQGNVAQAQQLVERWHATGKPFPLGPDDKPLLFFAIEGRAARPAENHRVTAPQWRGRTSARALGNDCIALGRVARICGTHRTVVATSSADRGDR